MAKAKLTDRQKLEIAEFYKHQQYTQEGLAELFRVDRKTIYRVLLSFGLLTGAPKLSPGSARIVELVKSYGLDADSLHQVLETPALTLDNIVVYLAGLKQTDLDQLIDAVTAAKTQAMKRLAEKANDQRNRLA